jgi:hypothetical protein
MTGVVGSSGGGEDVGVGAGFVRAGVELEMCSAR